MLGDVVAASASPANRDPEPPWRPCFQAGGVRYHFTATEAGARRYMAAWAPNGTGRSPESSGQGCPQRLCADHWKPAAPNKDKAVAPVGPAVRLARCPQDGAVRRRQPITLWSVLASGKTRTLDVGETGRAHPDWLKNGSRRP